MTNIFSNNDQNLPSLNMKLPKIKKGLPKIQMQNGSDMLFEIDGKNISMDEVANKFSSLFMQG